MKTPPIQRGILLMNLGSPDSTKVSDVRKYLHEFLMDDRVMDYPYLFRKLLVDGIITPFRAPKTAAAYRTIWQQEGSPLILFTEQLRRMLGQILKEPLSIGMRYGNPSTAAGLEEMNSNYPELKEVILFPLYPHYAMSSYETAVEKAKMVHRRRKYSFQFKIIAPFYNHPAYVNALAESIRPHLSEDFDQLLFSYHGLPERHIRKSDLTHSHCLSGPDCCTTDSPAHAHCYRYQVLTTTRLVAERLGLKPGKYAFSFQSRLGRDPWLLPDTARRFMELPKEGIRKLVVVCPSFVSDCLETLEEIAQRGKRSFLDAGGESFKYIPCLNILPGWINAIPEILKSNTVSPLTVH